MRMERHIYVIFNNSIVHFIHPSSVLPPQPVAFSPPTLNDIPHFLHVLPSRLKALIGHTIFALGFSRVFELIFWLGSFRYDVTLVSPLHCTTIALKRNKRFNSTSLSTITFYLQKY